MVLANERNYCIDKKKVGESIERQKATLSDLLCLHKEDQQSWTSMGDLYKAANDKRRVEMSESLVGLLLKAKAEV